jgi:hypothetical protein
VCELCKQLLRLEIGTLADWEEKFRAGELIEIVGELLTVKPTETACGLLLAPGAVIVIVPL